MKQILLLILTVLITHLGFSQTIDSVFITGQVVSKEWDSLPGVSIHIVDSKHGVVTDINGRFKMTVPIESVLSFSLISEPYYLSLCDLLQNRTKDSIDCIIRFADKNESKCKRPRSKSIIVKLDSDDRGSHAFNLVACYRTDFKRISLKHYIDYKKQNKEIIIMENGLPLDDDTKLESHDFGKYKDAYIMETTPNKYVFIFGL